MFIWNSDLWPIFFIYRGSNGEDFPRFELEENSQILGITWINTELYQDIDDIYDIKSE